MMPYYLISVVKFADQDTKTETSYQLAIVPILIYFSSVIASLQTKNLYLKLGR